MSLKRKIVSAAVAASLALTAAVSLSGCADVSKALTVDGEVIPAGVYILYSGYAQSDARQQLTEEQPDLDTTAEGFDYYNQTVEGVAFGDYVKQKTIDLCKRHIAVNRLFDELDIELEEGEEDTMSDNANAQWDFDVSDWNSTFTYLDGCSTMGDYYESIGVSKSSFMSVMTTSYRSGIIFRYYYGKGGIEEVPQSDINEYLAENYSLTRYFGISLNDSDGNLIESKTELAVLEKQAEDYAAELNDGGSFAAVYKEYQDSQSEDSEESGTEDSEEEELPEDSSYDRIINVESTSPSEEFVKALFEQKIGTADVFKADTYYYVVQRLDITENEEYTEDYNDTALEALKGDQMNSVFEEKYAGYSVTESSGIPDYVSQQSENAMRALSTISNIQYYASMFSAY